MRDSDTEMRYNAPPRIGVVFLGRRRPGFDMEWGKQMEARVHTCLAQSGFAIFVPSEKAVDDNSLRRVLAACAAEQVEAIVLLQTTMGDGRLAPTLAQLWSPPLILWATPENPEGDMISSCSLVGTHCWASGLRQLGHAFELVYGDPDSAATQQRLSEAVHLAVTVRRLRTARLGVIGGQAPGFFAMNADPFAIYHELGVQLQTFSLVEFANAVKGCTDEAVAADVAQVKALGLPHKDTTDDDLPMASRFYLAMKWFFENENLDALTIREWPEVPNVLGQWPYFSVARLVEAGRAVGVEGDADGALSAWIGESLGLGRCYLSDWLEHDEETITLWHGGMAPFSLCEPVGTPGGPRLARHFNMKQPMVVDATLRASQPITIFRFWRLKGEYFLTAREGETLKPRRPLMGTNALAQLPGNPGAWFEELCQAGMPHHVVVVFGHHAQLLKRFARLLGMQFI